MSFWTDIINAFTGGGSGGTSGGGSTFTPYSPTGLSPTDTSWQQIFQGLVGNLEGGSATGGTGGGSYQPLLAQGDINLNALNQYGAPELAQIAAAGPAMQGYYANMASQADAFHNLMSGVANKDLAAQGTMEGAGNTLWQTAADPQQALYKQMYQQVNDAANASTSMRGFGTSAEAAGIENKATTDFDIAWQNQQLQRQATGLQGMTQAYNQAGAQGQGADQAYAQSQAMSALAPQLIGQAAAAPYSQSMLAAMGPINAANIMAQGEMQDVLQPFESLAGMAIPYMNYGTGAQANAFNAGQANIGNVANFLSLLGGSGAVGKGLGALGGLFGGASPFAGYGATAAGGAGFADVAGGGLSGLGDAFLSGFGL